MCHQIKGRLNVPLKDIWGERETRDISAEENNCSAIFSQKDTELRPVLKVNYGNQMTMAKGLDSRLMEIFD